MVGTDFLGIGLIFKMKSLTFLMLKQIYKNCVSFLNFIFLIVGHINHAQEVLNENFA